MILAQQEGKASLCGEDGTRHCTCSTLPWRLGLLNLDMSQHHFRCVVATLEPSLASLSLEGSRQPLAPTAICEPVFWRIFDLGGEAALFGRDEERLCACLPAVCRSRWLQRWKQRLLAGWHIWEYVARQPAPGVLCTQPPYSHASRGTRCGAGRAVVAPGWFLCILFALEGAGRCAPLARVPGGFGRFRRKAAGRFGIQDLGHGHGRRQQD